MGTVALQQVTSAFAQRNAGKTLDKPIRLKYIQQFLQPEQFQTLASACADGTVYVWGSKFERFHQARKMLPRHCLFVFRRDRFVRKVGVLTGYTVNSGLADNVWGQDIDGQSWELIYFFQTVKDVTIPASEINRLIERSADDHWQGLVAVPSPAAERVYEYVKAELARSQAARS